MYVVSCEHVSPRPAWSNLGNAVVCFTGARAHRGSGVGRPDRYPPQPHQGHRGAPDGSAGCPLGGREGVFGVLVNVLLLLMFLVPAALRPDVVFWME